jgi:hypothetical protein
MPPEVVNVRKAAAFLRLRSGGVKTLASALRTSKALGRPCPLLAFKVARLASVGLDDVLTGKYPPAGVCAHCGHRGEAVQ